MIALLAVDLSVWDMDYHPAKSACETVATREHFIHCGGDDTKESDGCQRKGQDIASCPSA